MGRPRIIRVLVQEEFGRAVVGRGPQEPVAGADPVSSRPAALSLGRDAVSGGQPRVVPAIVVSGGDALRGDEGLADVRAAVGGVAEHAQCLEPELLVVSE